MGAAAIMCVSLQAEALKERSFSRMKLDVVIRAPLLVVPYSPAPSLSLPLSPQSSPSAPPTQRAFVANLGELAVRNVFRFASDVVAEELGRGAVGEQSQFLSPSGLPAVVDCMTVTISSVQLHRYIYTYISTRSTPKPLYNVSLYIIVVSQGHGCQESRYYSDRYRGRPQQVT